VLYGQQRPSKVQGDTPDWDYDDPAQKPGPDWDWRGAAGSKPGDPDGNWFNPKTRESLGGDLGHGPPIGPHWDYWRQGVKGHGRVDRNGNITWPDQAIQVPNQRRLEAIGAIIAGIGLLLLGADAVVRGGTPGAMPVGSGLVSA